MLPLTEWRLQHCSLRGIRAIRLVVASSNSMLSSDSLETGIGSSNSLFSASQSALFAVSAENSKIVRLFAKFVRFKGTGESQFRPADS
jgi:hypothetical protein